MYNLKDEDIKKLKVVFNRLGLDTSEMVAFLYNNMENNELVNLLLREDVERKVLYRDKIINILTSKERFLNILGMMSNLFDVFNVNYDRGLKELFKEALKMRKDSDKSLKELEVKYENIKQLKDKVYDEDYIYMKRLNKNYSDILTNAIQLDSEQMKWYYFYLSLLQIDLYKKFRELDIHLNGNYKLVLNYDYKKKVELLLENNSSLRNNLDDDSIYDIINDRSFVLGKYLYNIDKERKRRVY